MLSAYKFKKKKSLEGDLGTEERGALSLKLFLNFKHQIKLELI